MCGHVSRARCWHGRAALLCNILPLAGTVVPCTTVHGTRTAASSKPPCMGELLLCRYTHPRHEAFDMLQRTYALEVLQAQSRGETSCTRSVRWVCSPARWYSALSLMLMGMKWQPSGRPRHSQPSTVSLKPPTNMVGVMTMTMTGSGSPAATCAWIVFVQSVPFLMLLVMHTHHLQQPWRLDWLQPVRFIMHACGLCQGQSSV